MTTPSIPSHLQWRERVRGGKAIPSLHNTVMMLHAFGIQCRYNAFHDKILIGFRDATHEIETLIGEVSDKTLVMLRKLLSDQFNFDPMPNHVYDAVQTEAFQHCFDPILDMLEKAQADWDREKRLDAWVVNYLGCDLTDLNCAIGRKVLIAAVRRARSPGCKFDAITVLEGPEGRNKSTAIRILAGDANFSDQSLLMARDREVQEQLCGVWMHENADLAGMRRADVEHVKAFASRQVDIARPAYGKIVQRKPRRSIEWGTTNNSEYLQSQSGNRRFWPLSTGTIDVDGLTRDRLQLLGEAAYWEQQGETLLLGDGLWGDVADAQELRRYRDPWEDILENIPESVDANGTFGVKILHNGGGVTKVTNHDLLRYVLGVDPSQQNVSHGIRLSTIMRKHGWTKDRVVTEPGSTRLRGYWKAM